eukprot:TRINITY_DN2725_c0_g1_i1.p1 TRINITY_DN2725_c0_g1~~TRINITY_DN2725_c0_g1_i1.p1  ORF type:complete len:446 (-),score=46.93 TRINITY_DN2725_c0_g1_i1:229-1440(-)
MMPTGSDMGCMVEENANYRGDLMIVSGETNLKDSVEDCCAQCSEEPMCNMFVYCGVEAGCGPEAAYEFMRCDLKFSSSLANGGMPEAYSRGPEESFTSGYIVDKVIPKGDSKDKCPGVDVVTIVFGDMYPPLADDIFGNKALQDFITTPKDIESVYMFSAVDNDFCKVNAKGLIKGDVVIYADDTFPSTLEGLSKVQQIEGDLIILGMHNATGLESLEGLQQLKSISGSLYIEGIPSIAGLRVESVGKHVILKDVAELEELPIPEVSGDLSLSGKINSLEGLETITRVDGNVGIVQTSLTDLDGLNGLMSVGGAMLINSNSMLRSFEGLDSLTEVETLIVSKNPILKFLEPLSETLDSASNVHIYENGGISRNSSQMLFGIVAGTPAPIDDFRLSLVTLSQDI